MKAKRFTTCEKRAIMLCENIKKLKSRVLINVVYTKSRIWGSNPNVMFRGEKCTNISGCGYDKLSQALADALRFLFPVDSKAYKEVWLTGGAGENAFMEVLSYHGWRLKRVCAMWDGYIISRCRKVKRPKEQNH